MSAIDDYLDQVPPPQRAELDRIRAIVKQTVPEVEEVITYAMPGFKYRGKYLIAYAPFRDHLSVFPGAGAIQTLADQLTNFQTAKGTVQFSITHPIPDKTLKGLILARAGEIDGK